MPADLLARIRIHGAVPRHVAIIMDGNGRWARERRLLRPLGHRAGMAAVREAVEGAVAAGVEVLTLFAFSEENWQRPRSEIAALMELLEEYIDAELPRLRDEDVRVRVLGDRDRLSPSARAAVERLERDTTACTRLALNLCISYSSRAEIARAARLLAAEVQSGARRLEDVDEQALQAKLYTAGLPDPDLLIRTSGEHRISNFLLWQVAYAELYLTPVLWPDFRRRHLLDAVLAYQKRERRYGVLSRALAEARAELAVLLERLQPLVLHGPEVGRHPAIPGLARWQHRDPGSTRPRARARDPGPDRKAPGSRPAPGARAPGDGSAPAHRCR